MASILVPLALLAGLILTVEVLRSYNVISRIQQALHKYHLSNTDDALKQALQDVEPYQLPPLKVKTSTRMDMGLKRLDDTNWLTVDSEYLPEHALRQHFLATSRSNVIECLPPSKVACREVLDVAVSFLVSRFPSHFSISNTLAGPIIRNHLTGETFPIGSQCQNPLEVAALLAMEDFNILMKDEETGDYLLQASATLFPAGWKLQERIGTSMACLHAPVPGWSEKLGSHVNRYFDNLSSKTTMERSTLFVQTTPVLFQDQPEERPEDSAPPMLADIIIRRERQTFTRLPKSNAVLFTVRTYMTAITDLEDEQLLALRSQVCGWEEEMKAYKGYPIWGEVVEEYCEKKLGKRDESIKAVVGQCPC